MKNFRRSAAPVWPESLAAPSRPLPAAACAKVPVTPDPGRYHRRGNGIWAFQVYPPVFCVLFRGCPEDGKAQVTREPTGHPEADGARDPSRPPRLQPPRAATGPMPRAATGPMPRVPAAPDPAASDPAGRDPWSGTAPGFEFEGRRSRPRRGPQRTQPGRDQDPRGRPGQPESWDPAGGEPRRFRYTPMVSQPLSAPTQAWPDDGQLAMPGFEFDDVAQNAPAGAIPLTREPGPRARPDLRAASAEWAGLLRSLLPQPAKRRWSQEFRAGLEFRGWWARVAIPILAMVVFGVAVVVIAGANSGNSGPAPPATALGFPPATLAGNDFMAADSGRGITQTLGRVTSAGAEIVAVGSQAAAYRAGPVLRVAE